MRSEQENYEHFIGAFLKKRSQ